MLNAWDINVIPLNVSTTYTQFGSIQHWSNYGHNSHHGVTARVEKRYSAGMVVNAYYTFSKTMDDVDGEGGAGGITYYNRGREKGRKFMNGGGWARYVLGNWDLNYIQTAQSGLPFTISASGSSGPTSWCPMPNRPRLLTGRSARTVSRPRPRIRT